MGRRAAYWQNVLKQLNYRSMGRDSGGERSRNERSAGRDASGATSAITNSPAYSAPCTGRGPGIIAGCDVLESSGKHTRFPTWSARDMLRIVFGCVPLGFRDAVEIPTTLVTSSSIPTCRRMWRKRLCSAVAGTPEILQGVVFKLVVTNCF
jgi:hypothetical protein